MDAKIQISLHYWILTPIFGILEDFLCRMFVWYQDFHVIYDLIIIFFVSEGFCVQKRLLQRVDTWLLHLDLKEKMPLQEKKKKKLELSQRLDPSRKSWTTELKPLSF